ncbi:MAG: hypothetical protein NTV54_01210 [Ignavibacteriales bacterium]|nr:hypothetical protein [Ignavibacteriales bacterium]
MKRFLALLTLCTLIAVTGCKKDDSTDTPVTPVTPTDETGGLVGTWVSAGANVAPLLRTYFKTDSVIATFTSDLKYTVLQYDSGKAVQTLGGTFAYTKSTKDTLNGTIYSIVASQATPTTLIARGIYVADKVAAPNKLYYEVVADGAGTAPTPATGLASTKSTTGLNLALYGLSNVQKYVKR